MEISVNPLTPLYWMGRFLQKTNELFRKDSLIGPIEILRIEGSYWEGYFWENPILYFSENEKPQPKPSPVGYRRIPKDAGSLTKNKSY